MNINMLPMQYHVKGCIKIEDLTRVSMLHQKGLT